MKYGLVVVLATLATLAVYDLIVKRVGVRSARERQEGAMTPEAFFAGKPIPYRLFAQVVQMLEPVGPVTLRVSRSQIAFRRRRGFAWVWMPDRYLRGPAAPLVLSIALPWRDGSPRWKQVAEPAPGRFMHHLELREPAELDGEVGSWLRQAWDAAA